MPSLPRRLLLLALFCTAATASAGGIALVDSEDGQGGRTTVRIEFFDQQRLRMSSPAQPQGYLLLHQGTPYSVFELGGNVMVMEVGQMLGVMGVQPGQALDTGAEDIARFIALEPLKQGEVVAGIAGERWRLRYADAQNREHSEEVVLSGDARVRELSQATVRLGMAMAQAAGVRTPEGSEQLRAQLEARKLGLLRFGQRMRLQSIQAATLPAERFELPAEPMSAEPAFPAFP